MKFIPSLAVLTALAVCAAGIAPLSAAEKDGVALAIVYDTSGSMKEPVRDQSGMSFPKYLIANHALIAVADHIQNFLTNSATGTPRKVDTALFVFAGNGAREALRLAPFDAKALQDWANGFSNPNGGTPLGNALTAASRAVLNSPLPRKHVLVITDGNNTIGPQPAGVMPGLMREAQQKQGTLSIHFIAFDVDAKVFDPVKKLGATVVSAANEPQLNTQLDFILQRKILLEDEEPANKK